MPELVDDKQTPTVVSKLVDHAQAAEAKEPEEVKHATDGCKLSSRSPSLQADEEASDQSPTREASPYPVTTSQGRKLSEHIAESGKAQVVSCGAKSSASIGEGADHSVQQEADVRSQGQLATAIKFSEAITRRCRSTQQSTIDEPERLRTDIISQVELYSRIMLGSATSGEGRSASHSVAEHRRSSSMISECG